MASSTQKPGWLFILPWELNSIGGVSAVVKSLISEVNADGTFRPIVLVSDWSCVTPVVSECEVYTEIRWRLYPMDLESIKGVFALLFKLSLLKRLFNKICDDYNVSVFNPHYPTSSSFVFLLHRNNKKLRVLFSFHGVDVTNLKNKSIINRCVWKYVLSRSDALITCSNGLKHKLLNVYPDFVRKSVTVYNGVGKDFNKEISSSVNSSIRLPSKVILSVGTFEEKKGQDILISAFSDVHKKFPGWNLVLVGRQTAYLDKYKELVRCLGLQEVVHFYTDILPEDMPSIYSQSDIFVLPSRIEPFGLVILEAAMSGLPVIATKTDGALEIIEDQKDGILVDIGSAHEMRDVLIGIIQSEIGTKRMASQLKRKAVSDFSWSKCFQSYMDLISNKNSVK
ncbi:glycosyltransferase family 4 protein [Aestuariicella sp. G3-2]|uniref:glycosyltransferase family 4 protein n=1 Tax=Pseudomaricurvus albidus TaxID=2842452 RepID=UPI001C0CBBD5|nr:glycosyltransferase family 4 protein [Aestuariicella albida]MBU3070889.1 glycosyltransferase family 4 protein [Aestuariicella albida]